MSPNATIGCSPLFLAPATNKGSHGVGWHHIRCILVGRCLSVPHSTVSKRFSSKNQHLPLEMSPNATITNPSITTSSSSTGVPAMRLHLRTRVEVDATVLGGIVGGVSSLVVEEATVPAEQSGGTVDTEAEAAFYSDHNADTITYDSEVCCPFPFHNQLECGV